MEHEVKQGIGIERVSSVKQGITGDSHDDQREQIEPKANLLNIKIVKWFEFTESASGEAQPCQEAVDYCKTHPEIKFALIKSIDRFTRGGSYFYDHLKMQLTRYGVQLIDVQGVISGQTVNTLEHLGIKYDWSVYSPSKVSELIVAERAKDEVRDILTRMLGAEIRYVRLGYGVRAAPPGFTNEYEDTEHGRRIVRKPHPVESPWFIKMFELRARGDLSDKQIVDEINTMGYKSRRLRVHDKQDRSKIVGYKGENPLTIKKLQEHIKKPIYAGVNVEKWTNGQPVKARFPGLVSVSMFNAANRGKVTIIEENEVVKIYNGQTPHWLIKRKKNNPLYPYKDQVLCPTCRKPLLGSASRGKSGQYFPACHCSRGHKLFRVPLKTFQETIERFVRGVRFSERFIQKLKASVVSEWEAQEAVVTKDAINYGQRIIAIDQECLLIKDKIKQVTSPATIQMLEADIDKLQSEKTSLITQRDGKEDEQLDIQVVLNYIAYYVEHLEELLLGGSDPIKRSILFGLLFLETPTYNDLVNGTPNLAPLFELDKASQKSDSDLARLAGIEPASIVPKTIALSVEL